MFAPLRINTPRLAYFGLEGGLILALFYGLADVTLLVLRDAPTAHKLETVVLAGVLFSIVLMITQYASFSRQSNLGRELLLITAICVPVGILAFVAVSAALGDYRRIEALIPLEGAIAVPAAVALWRLFSARFTFLDVRERVLIVGTGETARQICRWIVTNRPDDYTIVGFADLLIVLGAWGPCPAPCPPFCTGDIDEDCAVGIADLLILLSNWY